MAPRIVYADDGGTAHGAWADELVDAIAWLDSRARERGYPAGVPLAGVTLGGCVDAVGTYRAGAMRRAAHAHVDAGDKHRGWVCVAAYSLPRIVTSTGMPTELFRHEAAHLLAPTDNGHGDRWRRAVIALGAPAEAKRAAARSEDRRARRANTVYYVAGEMVDRATYLASTRRTLAAQREENR